MTVTRSRAPRRAPEADAPVASGFPTWAELPRWLWPSDAVAVYEGDGRTLVAAWDGGAEAWAE